MAVNVGAYAYYEYVEMWPELAVAIFELEMRLRRRELRPDLADRLLRAYGELRDGLRRLAIATSLFATEELKRSERDTRVRPDTHGEGGPRLEDYLEAKPVGPQDLMPGSVGVANWELLDAEVPWWITNEIGNSTNVGRVLWGTFYGSESAAAPAEELRREHPLFAPGPGPASGTGMIENPIPARRFIAKAVPKITAFWRSEFNTLISRYDAEFQRIISGLAVRP
jgi:hypothetical protein